MFELIEPLALLLSDDLLFTSRIQGTARDQRIRVRQARTAANLLSLAREESPYCVIVDLANPGLNLVQLLADLRAIGAPMPRVVAYGSHVDTETLRQARAAGCDPVLPRSKFVEDLPQQLANWMETTSGKAPAES